MKDYSKIKAMAQEILKCIGEDEEGENPPVYHTDNEDSPGGAPSGHHYSYEDDAGNIDLLPNDKQDDMPAQDVRTDTGEEHKKRKDDVLKLLSSTLASKFNK